MVTAVIAAIIAALASIGSVFFTARGQRELKRRDEAFKRSLERHQFVAEKLEKLYLPVSMHLRSTKALYDRYFEASTSAEEKEAIEHELKAHNRAIRECLMDRSAFLEPDAPEAFTTGLLEHILQWEIVYALKYEHKAYSGPVFAGISDFGYREFPKEEINGQGIDEYYSGAVKQLRGRLHERHHQA